MKGIVVDTKGKYAVALSKDGSFIKIRNSGHFKVGFEIELDQAPRFYTSTFARVSSIAAAFLFTLGLGYSVYSYTTPYSYIGLDINPSIELTTNIYDRIIGTEALNADGEKLLTLGSFKNRKLAAGITELLDRAIQQGYLNAETDNAVILTVTSKDEDKSEYLQKGLEDAAAKELGKDKVNTAVTVEKATVEEHESAREMGISPGKLSLIEKAMEEEPDLKLEDLKDAPVKDIMKHLKKDKNNGSQDGKTGEEVKQPVQQEKDDKSKPAGKSNPREKSDKGVGNNGQGNGNGEKDTGNGGNGKDNVKNDNKADKEDKSNRDSKEKTKGNDGKSGKNQTKDKENRD